MQALATWNKCCNAWSQKPPTPFKAAPARQTAPASSPLEEPWIHATGSIVEVGDNIATWNVCGFSPAILDPNAPQNLEELQAADPKEVAQLSKFDGRNYGIITPVRDQGSSNLCWAYASVNASEASILREGIDPSATLDTLRFSPTHLGYIRFNRGPDLLGNTAGEEDPTADWLQASGSPGYSSTLFSQWWGPVQDGTPMVNTPKRHRGTLRLSHGARNRTRRSAPQQQSGGAHPHEGGHRPVRSRNLLLQLDS